MISRDFRFDDFIQAMHGHDFADVLSTAIEESNGAQRADRATRGRRLSYRPALDYYRKLSALVFFLRYGVRPGGMANEDFQLIRPLCEEWIKKGQMLNTILKLFGENIDSVKQS